MIFDDLESLAAGLAIGLGVIFLILFIAIVISYVLNSLVYMKVFKMFGTCNPILAWVPFVSSYMLGKTCNGRSGENNGIFGVRVPNWMYNFGWAFPFAAFALSFTIGVVSVLTNVDLGFIGTVLWYAVQAFNFLYYASIYSFVYSRMEGKYENQVRVISIVSAIFGIVWLIKILGAPVGQVYSLDNDMYPEDTGVGGGSWQGGYNQQQYGGYDGGGSQW